MEAEKEIRKYYEDMNALDFKNATENAIERIFILLEKMESEKR